MASEKNSGKKDLKRTLVLSGLALASFVSAGAARAEETTAEPVNDNRIVPGTEENATTKTGDLLAGIDRGGFGSTATDDTKVLDPLNPWGPSPGGPTVPVNPNPNPDPGVSGGGTTDPKEGAVFYPPGWYGGYYYPGGYWGYGYPGYYGPGYHHGYYPGYGHGHHGNYPGHGHYPGHGGHYPGHGGHFGGGHGGHFGGGGFGGHGGS